MKQKTYLVSELTFTASTNWKNEALTAMLGLKSIITKLAAHYPNLTFLPVSNDGATDVIDNLPTKIQLYLGEDYVAVIDTHRIGGLSQLRYHYTISGQFVDQGMPRRWGHRVFERKDAAALVDAVITNNWILYT